MAGGVGEARRCCGWLMVGARQDSSCCWYVEMNEGVQRWGKAYYDDMPRVGGEGGVNTEVEYAD